MLKRLNKLPPIIDAFFGVLEMFVVRLALLGLLAYGAYSLMCVHFHAP
jgi:hypothetical protein